MNKLIEQLKIHEGFRSTVYTCSGGKKLVGYGRNLEDIGISEEEAEMLLKNDIYEATNQLLNAFPWMATFSDARISAMINFTFNVGIGTVKTSFTKSIECFEEGRLGTSLPMMMLDSQMGQIRLVIELFK